MKISRRQLRRIIREAMDMTGTSRPSPWSRRTGKRKAAPPIGEEDQGRMDAEAGKEPANVDSEDYMRGYLTAQDKAAEMQSGTTSHDWEDEQMYGRAGW